MKKLALLAISLLFFLSSSYICNAAEKKQILVVFRYDDYSSRSPTDLEVKLIDAFRRHNFSCTFGVIPYICDTEEENWKTQNVVPLTAAKIDILRTAIKANIVDVALHGYSHHTISENKNDCSEFFGVDYKLQLAKISNGKKYLEKLLDTKINTFIPPWNSYDMNTVRAIESLGFDTISANIYGVAEQASLLKYLPRTSKLIYAKEAIKSAALISDTQPIVVVIFHSWNFSEINKEKGKTSYKEFTELLDWLASQKDVYVCTIKQAKKIGTDLSARRFISNKFDMNILPPSVVTPCLGLVYYSQGYIDNIKFNIYILRVALYSAFLFCMPIGIVFLCGLMVIPKTKLIAIICVMALAGIFIGIRDEFLKSNKKETW